MGVGREQANFVLDGAAAGMLGRGWACFGLTAVPGSENTVDNALRKRAMEAINGFVYFAPVVPRKPQFLKLVQTASNKYFNASLDRAESVSPYAMNLFDAIMLYTKTLSETRTIPIDTLSGLHSNAREDINSTCPMERHFESALRSRHCGSNENDKVRWHVGSDCTGPEWGHDWGSRRHELCH